MTQKLKNEMVDSVAADKVTSDDGSGGTLWTNVAGLVARLRSSAGSSIIGFIQAGTDSSQRNIQDKLRERISVKDFGAKGDGSTDDTAAITAADVEARKKGGQVYFPQGTYMVSQLTLYTNTNWVGDGRDGSVIKQIAGSNRDLLYGVNSNACWSSNTPTGFAVGFTLRNLTLNGNRSGGNTTGSGIAAFAPRPILDNVFITDIAEHGMRTEYLDVSYGGVDTWAMEGYFNNVRIDGTGKHGWLNNGPHDSIDVSTIIIDSSQSEANAYSGIYFGPRSNGRHVSTHVWTRSWSLRAKTAIEIIDGTGGHDFSSGCHFEGGYVANVILSGNNCRFDATTRYYAAWNGWNVVLTGPSVTNNSIEGFLSDPGPSRPACIGIKLGHYAGDYVASNRINVQCTGQEAGNIVFDPNNTGGDNMVHAKCYNATNTTVFGTPSSSDDIDIVVRNSAGKSTIYNKPISTPTQTALDLLGAGSKMAVLVGDYSTTTGLGTDDGPAILQQLTTLSASGGGKLIIPYGKKPYVGSSFEMPRNTALEFEKLTTGTHDGLQLPNQSGTIWLSSAATITMTNATTLKANVFRAGWTPGLTSTQVATTFLGQAISLKSNCSNITIEGMIIGFLKSIESQNPNNADGTSQSNRLDIKVIVDCINGPHIHNSYDISRINGIHCWPFSSVTAPAETNGAQLKRSGSALWLSGVNDWTMAFQCFSYGYAVGVRLTDCSAVTINNCGMDHVPGAADGSIGYLLEGNTREIKLQSVQTAGKEFGIVVNSTTSTGRMAAIITAPTVWVTKTAAIDIIAGTVQIVGGSLRNDPVTTPNGIGIRNRNPGSGEVHIIGVDFCGLDTAIDNGSSTMVLRHHLCTFRAVNVQIKNAYMPTIASTATIVPNGVDTVFTLTGTTNVGNISSPQRYAGKMVTFICTGGLTFLFGGNIIPRSGANTVVAANRVFCVVSDGTNWYEV